MKILFLSASSGDTFYCGNCFRDNLYAQALSRAGHEVVFMPLYLPLAAHNHTPVFFSATSFYVAQKLFGGRALPTWLDRTLNAPWLLNVASSLSGTTSPIGLEEITLAMIHGNGAAFRNEAHALSEWIRQQGEPDVIHLPTTLMIGIARYLKQEFTIPIVCSIKDEEIWLDKMRPQFIAQAWDSINANLHHVDSFVTVSHYYRNYAQSRLPNLKEVNVIYPGVNLTQYSCPTLPEAFTLGYFNRMNDENGLSLITDAYLRLKPRHPHLRLHIGGGYTSQDNAAVRRTKKLLQPHLHDVMIEQGYTTFGHETFFSGITLFCAPIKFNEAIGFNICESLAAGRPIVAPSTGSFPEIVEDAGVLYEANSVHLLTESIEKMIQNKELYSNCRNKSLTLSRTKLNDSLMAEQLLQLYNEVMM